MRDFFFVNRLKGQASSYKKVPTRATENSAGYDIYVPCSNSGKYVCYTLNPGDIVNIPLGIKVAMELDEVLLVFIRSSLGRTGLTIVNGTGIIDADYYENPDNDGEISIVLRNDSEHVITINSGDRVAQGIFTKYLKTDSDIAGGKRKGGYGSTGL